MVREKTLLRRIYPLRDHPQMTSPQRGREGSNKNGDLRWFSRLNPKRCELFGQLRRRRRESGLWMLQFSFKLNKQYFIWKLIYSAKIWDLIEVAEAHTLASEGIGSDRGQNKKNEGKILESPIFDLQKRNIPQKKPHENRHSYLKQNKRLLLWKNWKKNRFRIFSSKKL